ncbi:COP23 domain-containing protein [Microcoleus sp. w2-18bC1]|uniref:COP23 domain-containing protein n=1 Tax=unclassified Microcoleus TaxID=2642155 RepID=UPI002FD64DC5
MKFQSLASLSCLAMAVAGMVTLTSEAQAQRIGPSNPPAGGIPLQPTRQVLPPAMTTVRCAGTVTVAEKNGRQAPIITWTTNYFGEQYTPETRCQMVSSKLHNAVMANGGTFAGMRFFSGIVNRDLVICVLGTGQSQCNSGNMLFTLKPENRPRVGQILEEITNFSTKGTSGIRENRGEGIQVDISDLDQELGTSDPTYAPQSPSQPAPNETIF